MTEQSIQCPECGSKMIRRTNRKEGTEFYGCSLYPECKGTRPITVDRMDDLDDRMPSDKARRNDRQRWRE